MNHDVTVDKKNSTESSEFSDYIGMILLLGIALVLGIVLTIVLVKADVLCGPSA